VQSELSKTQADLNKTVDEVVRDTPQSEDKKSTA
jgi:hypothetical protein